MGRTVTAVCCFLVALQLLVGVPLAVCAAFFAFSGGLGPVSLEVHAVPHQPQMFVHAATVPPPPSPFHHLPGPASVSTAPPPNIIPAQNATAIDHPILETRAAQGSPLTGTILSEGSSPSGEQELFVAALQKVASETVGKEQQAPECTNQECTNQAALPMSGQCELPCELITNATAAGDDPSDHWVIQQLYTLAERDERAAKYERADQWRALAREIRQSAADSPRADETAANSNSIPASNQ
jgi:hypothetical protein